ncbi:MAG: GDSL-type esterase/lipase family protein, partial [bacterium]
MWRLNKLVMGSICITFFCSGHLNFCFGPVKALNSHTFLKAIADDSSKKKSSLKTILFLGNSLTAGYNLEPTQAFPNLIQQKIDSMGWHYTAINAGLSGETSSGGLRRINWLLKRKIDILVLELGGNDVLRGIPLELTKKNLQAIIDQTRKKYPEVKIVIAGLQA